MKTFAETNVVTIHDSTEALILYRILKKSLSNNRVIRDSVENIEDLDRTLNYSFYSTKEELMIADMINALTHSLMDLNLLDFGNPDDNILN